MAAGEPAGGAPVQDLVPAALVGGVLTAAVLAVGLGHRAGRVSFIGRARGAGRAGRAGPGLGRAAGPGARSARSASPPSASSGTSRPTSTTAATPGRSRTSRTTRSSLGLAGVALAGFLAAVLGADDARPRGDRWAPGWRIPLGGALLLLCGGLAMIGFPLDDVWHRIFGQDVTLWGPTHVLMIGGASLAPIAAWLLLVEGRCAAGKPRPRPAPCSAWEVQLAGAALIGLSTLQLEFGYGVPQFQLVFHPILIALAASIGLVAARVRLGRGGALAATGAYLLVMVPMVLIVGPGFGHTFMHFPLYIVEAVLVELAALALRAARSGFGIGAGVLIGTVGVAAEWAWSQVAMPLPWNGLAAARGAAAGARRPPSPAACIGAHLGGAPALRRGVRDMPRLVPAAALAVADRHAGDPDAHRARRRPSAPLGHARRPRRGEPS